MVTSLDGFNSGIAYLGRRYVVRYMALPIFVCSISTQAADYRLDEKGIERLNQARSVSPLAVDTLFGE